MVPARTLNLHYDPVGMLDDALERTWDMLRKTYEVSAELPEMLSLFAEATLFNPEQAADSVLVNMIMEIMESVGRFSPWYRMNARAYGLTSIRDSTTDRVHWMLAPEARQKWQVVLEDLAVVIEKNSGLIQAMILVEGFTMKDEAENPCVVARCDCTPPRTIRLQRSIFENTEIVCDLCHQPFAS
jgi:hypothetical protein